MRRRNWPIVLAILFIAQLAWYLLYTEHIAQALGGNAEGLSEIYAQVQGEIIDPRPWEAEQTLFDLQGIIVESGVPIIVSGSGDTIVATVNLPVEVDLNLPEGQARLRELAAELDRIHPPIGDSAEVLIHYGDPPVVRGLQWIPWFQAGGLLLTAVLGILSIRVQRRAEGDRAWTAMARELAHQLGTPISSLQGWLELLLLPGSERPQKMGEGEIAQEIGEDLSRLERITNRFELIGREPELEEMELSAVLASLRDYLEARIPRFASGVTLDLVVPEDFPPIMGNEVLLTWAFENVVKNALDALGGKGGTIRIQARVEKGKGVVVSVEDTGPGVPKEVRDQIFEPGVTTKELGWGVGLALSRRIVEVVHRGKIELGAGDLEGATFLIRLPSPRSPLSGGRSFRKNPSSQAPADS